MRRYLRQYLWREANFTRASPEVEYRREMIAMTTTAKEGRTVK